MRFFLKLFLLAAVLFAGIGIGMQKANEGMVSMKGYEEASFPSPLEIKETEGGQAEAAVLGKGIGIDHLKEKKERLESLETFNFFSEMGKSFSSAVTSFTKKVFSSLLSLLRE